MGYMKIVAKFNMSTVPADPGLASQRVGGWSESLYVSGDSVDVVKSVYDTWKVRRTAILASYAGIVSATFIPVDIVNNQLKITGPAQTVSRAILYGQITSNDVPQMSMLAWVKGVGAGRRKLRFAGLPDTWVVGGEFTTGGTANAVARIFDLLRSYNGTYYPTVNRANPVTPVISVSAGGLVTTPVNITVVEGDYVSPYRSRNVITNRPVRGRYLVSSVTDAKHFTIANWPYGAVDQIRMRRMQTTMTSISSNNNQGTDFQFERVVLRKVGRPFGQFVGHRRRQ